MESTNRIIAFAGQKQSGKSTSMKFIHGLQLKMNGIAKDFWITEGGDLIVEVKVEDEKGNSRWESVQLDMDRDDPEFLKWSMYAVWPFVKRYSFAGPLKSIAVDLFGIPAECCFGTEEQKNQIQEHLLWENMPGVITCSEFWNSLCPDGEPDGLTHHAAGPMTAREFLQCFGTDICRTINTNVWVNLCINSIKAEGSLLAVIDDCRFPNEVEAIQAAGGKVIGLTRGSDSGDSHASETSISQSWGNLDCIIDNQNMSIGESCQSIASAMEEWGWIEKQ